MRPVSIIGSLLALAVGYGLWLLSGMVEDQIGAEALLPIIRVIIVIGGLSLADMVFAKVMHALSGPITSANGDHP